MDQAIDGLDKCLNKALDVIDSLKNLEHSGEALLNVKAQALTSYQSAVLEIISHKSQAKSLESIQDTVFKTCKERIILERIRPLELKLQDKWSTLMKSKSSLKNDPLALKPNLDNIGSSDEEDGNPTEVLENDSEIESDSEKSENDEQTKSKKYVPPKITPMPYPGEKESSEAVKERTQKARKRALESSQIRELEEQYGDRPVEYSENKSFDSKSRKVLKAQKDRESYELENYKRLSVSKKQKRQEQKVLNRDEFETIASFGDIGMLQNKEVVDFMAKKKRTRKGGKKDLGLIFGKKKRGRR